MISREILDIILCPTCGADAVGVGSDRHPSLECGGCGADYPIVHGIPDLTPRAADDDESLYQPETLYDNIARVFDVAFPLMSLAVWRCPPVRYVDWAHRAVGRGLGGRMLSCPVSTGFILDHVQSPHTQIPIVATDVSWRMLRRAQKRFKRHGRENITLIRARPEQLPFKEHAFRSVMSLNGPNGFEDREAALSELFRVSEPSGWIAGSAICRGLSLPADTMLRRYERLGIYPILRSREYLVSELAEAFRLPEVRFETYGAVVFFMAGLKG